MPVLSNLTIIELYVGGTATLGDFSQDYSIHFDQFLESKSKNLTPFFQTYQMLRKKTMPVSPQSVDVKEDANEAMLRHMPGNLTSHDKR